VCSRKLGVPKLQHKFSSPEWEIYKVSLKALRHEMSSDVGRDRGHSLLTKKSTSPGKELSTICDVSGLSSTAKIVHGTYTFPR